MEEAIIRATLRFARENLSNPSAVEQLLKHVRFGYRPFWGPRNDQVVAYRCTPYVQDGNHFREGRAVLPIPPPEEAKVVLDELTIPNVTVDIEAMIREERPAIVVVPLHYVSFINGWSAERLVELCGNIPAAGRAHIIFDIVDASDGRSDHRLRAALRQLRPFCRLIGATLPLRRQELKFWREIGFRSVIVDLSDAAEPEDELITELDRFQMAAHQEGLLPILHGARSRSIALAAATMGFDLVHSRAILNAAHAGKLDRTPFAIPDLYADLLKNVRNSGVWEV